MPFFFPMFGSVVVIVLVGLAALAFNIWMLVDAVKRPESDFDPPGARVWWIVGLAIAIFLSWLGLAVALVYFFLVRKPISEGRPATPLTSRGSAPPGKSGRMCPNCGEPIGTHSRYCQYCGTPVDLEDR